MLLENPRILASDPAKLAINFATQYSIYRFSIVCEDVKLLEITA